MTIRSALGFFVAAERLGAREIHVAGDEQIEVAVAVEVGKRTARAPAAAGYSRGCGHIGKSEVASILVQRVAPDARDVQIDVTVVVDVARAHAHAVLVLTDA